MPLKCKSLRKTELEFEIIIRNGKLLQTVEENRQLLRDLLHIDPVKTFTFDPLSKKDIFNSLLRLKSDIKSIKSNPESINREIFEENYNSIDRRFRITTQMPLELQGMWELVQESWQTFVERSLGITGQPTVSDPIVQSATTQISEPSVSGENKGTPESNDENLKNTTTLDNLIASKISSTIETQAHGRFVDISKLQLSYNGNSCVFEFLERIGELAISRSISETALLRGLPELLSGSALMWYRQVRDSITSWDHFQQILKNKFQPEDYQFRLSKQIYIRTQSKHETVADYFFTMHTLFSRLARPMPEDQRLEILLRNVRPVYSNQFGLNVLDSVEKLQSFCERLEQNHMRSKFFCEPPVDFLSTGPTHSGRVETAIESSGSRQSPEKKENNVNKSRVFAVRSFGKKRTCLRCDTNDHPFWECPRKDQIICFKCKAPGEKAPTCSNCKIKQNHIANRDSEGSQNNKNNINKPQKN